MDTQSLDDDDDDKPVKFKKIDPKTQVKRLRLTEDENLQLNNYLEKHNFQFSDFCNTLIRKAISADYHLVEITDYVKPHFPIKQKKHHRPPPKVAPELLFELGRIGTNLNQVARALNVIKNDKEAELDLTEQFSFIECLQALQLIQTDIHSVIGELKQSTMSEKAIENARNRIIKAVELPEPEDADVH
jgi:hypothetical protein